MLIPGVNLVIGIMLIVDLAKSYGKGAGFAVGMMLLSVIFYPILAFGDAEYQRIDRATAQNARTHSHVPRGVAVGRRSFFYDAGPRQRAL